VVSSPRISIGPAGSCINRNEARRGWATETHRSRRRRRRRRRRFIRIHLTHHRIQGCPDRSPSSGAPGSDKYKGQPSATRGG